MKPRDLRDLSIAKGRRKLFGNKRCVPTVNPVFPKDIIINTKSKTDNWMT